MLRMPEPCANYGLSVDAEGEVVLGCGGRTLHTSGPYVHQTVPLLPLGRPERLRVLAKRPANFPLGQDFFSSTPHSGARLEQSLDDAVLASEDSSIKFVDGKVAKRLRRLQKLGKGCLYHTKKRYSHIEARF
jgi:hypothetical protein